LEGAGSGELQRMGEEEGPDNRAGPHRPRSPHHHPPPAKHGDRAWSPAPPRQIPATQVSCYDSQGMETAAPGEGASARAESAGLEPCCWSLHCPSWSPAGESQKCLLQSTSPVCARTKTPCQVERVATRYWPPSHNATSALQRCHPRAQAMRPLPLGGGASTRLT
jgi:hypothetical protein